MASRAFTVRLSRTASSSAGSASTGHTPPLPTTSSETSSPSACRRNSERPLNSRLTSSAVGLSGCCREKANSRLVRVAARCAPRIAFSRRRASLICPPSVHDSNWRWELSEVADGEKIIEIMRDAAGEMTDRFQLEGLPQGLFGSHAPVDLLVEMPCPAQYREQGQEKNERGGNAEYQMGRHSSDPLVANGGTRDSGAQVQRRFAEAAHAKTPLDPIDGRGRGVKAALRVLGDGAAEAGALAELFRRAGRRNRVARQERAVRAQQ